MRFFTILISARRREEVIMATSATPSHGDDFPAESTPSGSTYVRPQDMEWRPSQFEGISIKVLYEDRERGEMTCLLKWEPGARLPFHRHPEIEQSLVLEGSFYDHDGIARAGEYVWRKPHSKHETRSDEGCVILAVYRKPNVFRGGSGFSAG
jgi:anti-sigma factor ChrR (cupin superfamily)